MSSSQLTKSYFSEGWPNHQPVSIWCWCWCIVKLADLRFKRDQPTSHGECSRMELGLGFCFTFDGDCPDLFKAMLVFFGSSKDQNMGMDQKSKAMIYDLP